MTRDDSTGALPADLQNLIARNKRATEPTPAELAAEVLGQYFTADDIRQGIAEGGSIDVLAFRDDQDGEQS